jgi:pimeloyl-ACP methyl ester carboxylesterase
MRFLKQLWVFSILRFGSEARSKSWNSRRLSGSDNSDSGVIIFGGLTLNTSKAFALIARLFYRDSNSTRDVWCVNMSGHTGRLKDLTKANLWHWIKDANNVLFKMSDASNKKDVLLMGHSTSGLTLLALLVLSEIRKLLGLDKDRQLNLKAALLFPAFRLQSRFNEIMLLVVALLYYFLCPLIFIYLGTTSLKILPLAIPATILHFVLVPRIWIPYGDSRTPKWKKRRWIVSELILLSALCIFFVTMPVVIILIHRVQPAYSSTVMGLFIISLLSILFLIPQKKSDRNKIDKRDGYDYLPVITATNVVLLQIALLPFLTLIKAPVLILHSEADDVVYVPKIWCWLLSRNSDLTEIQLKHMPHSKWSDEQKVQIYEIVAEWEKNVKK